MKKILRVFVFLVIFVSGLAVTVYPNVTQTVEKYKVSVQIREFESAEKENPELYRRMQEYNQRIYEEGQQGLKDAWSYQQNEFDFSGLNADKDMIGYISIDAMGIELPLYVGATEENMRNGAAVLGQTSMPIGGTNTNCVIAAHRGMSRAAMFRDIEVLTAGDVIRIVNPWDTLEYEVVKCIAISPDDIDAVKIIEGGDMVTLITCHPYTHNYQRYVVYAKRKGTEPVDIAFQGQSYESSRERIVFDRTVNRAGILFFVGILLLLLILWIVKRIRRRRLYH